MAVHRVGLNLVLVLAVLCATTVGFAQSSVTSSSSAPKSSTAKKKPVHSTHRRNSPRLQRMHQAFVESAALKPMARQLLQDRTPAAYAGVEAYARRHAKEDAGALAWLVVGYAHVLDRDYAKAIDPLSRAKARAGDIGDYVSYYLGFSYFQTGRIPEAIATLSVFDKTYPESLLTRDSHVIYANALLSDGRAADAAELLEKDRSPIRPDLELALGRAYAASGDPAKAATIFRNLYYTMPLSGEANSAQTELSRLPANLQAAAYADRKSRADLLAKGKQYNEAANEYRALQDEAPAGDRPALQVEMADALRHAGRAKEAKKALESMPSASADINAQVLFNLGELARGVDDDQTFFKLLDQLRQTASTSPWLEQALLSAGNIYLLRHDYDKAIDSFRELQQRFPNGGRASYAHWKVAWLTLRQGRNADAKKAFEDQIALYPASSEVPDALYWRARLAEEDNDAAMARAYYVKISQRYRNYYYGELARQRLAKLKESEGDPPAHYALLDRVPAIDSGAKVVLDQMPPDSLRVQKAQLLANGALLDFSIRELRAAADEEKGNWLPAETARLYQDAGRYDAAVEVMKRAVPNYFAVDIPYLPRAYWEALFPKPFWLDLKKFSSSNALDPYLVAALIRQESEFNPNAVSRANAVGLMQLLPKVGKSVAKDEKLRHFTPSQLFVPATNLQLGTKYFRLMVDKFGAFEYALAAYNAGSDRVQDWQGQGKYRDPQEFVESIPFTETREYVQAILRNANVYRQLYGTP